MTVLAKSSILSLPSLLSPAIQQAVDMAVRALDPPFDVGPKRYSIALSDAPSAHILGALEDRKAMIDRWMLPCGHDVATREYKLLCTMDAPAMDAESVRLEMLAFVGAASKLPVFALQEACAAFRLGKIGAGKWMPKTGEVCREAERRMAGLAKERLKLEAVLGATIRTPQASVDHRAKVAEAVKADLRDMANEGRRAEAMRAGRDFDVRTSAPPETPRSLAERISLEPFPVLSAATREKVMARFVGDHADG